MIILPILVVALVAFVVFDVKGGRRGSFVRPEERPVHSTGSDARVALALTRVEATRFALHPSFAVGLAFAALSTWALVTEPAYLRLESTSIPLLYFPLCGMVLIAVNMITTRARRHGTEELFETLPASASARTWGALGSAIPGPVAALIALATLVTVSRARGSIGIPNLWDLGTVLVLVACAALVGVAVGRWVPSGAAGLLALVVLGLFQGGVTTWAGLDVLSPMRAFAPWHGDPEVNAIAHIIERRPGWHLVYLAGLALLVLTIAMMRARIDRTRMIALSSAFVLIAVGGVAQSRSNEASVQRAAAFLSNPADHHVCETRANVTLCAFDPTRAAIDGWARPVEGVLAALPSPIASRPLRVQQRLQGGEFRLLPPRLLGLIRAPAPTSEPFVWADDGNLHVGFGRCKDGICDLAIATGVAAWALDLPLAPDPATAWVPEPDWDPYGEFDPTSFDGMLDTSGQARGAVALWLAARATPEARVEYHKRVLPGVTHGFPVVTFTGCRPYTDLGVTFGLRDAGVAHAMLALPDADVERVLESHWDAIVDGSTSTGRLLGWLSLPPTTAELGVRFEPC